MLQVEVVHFFGSKDKKNLIIMSYIRNMQEIWKVDYVTFRVQFFKCKWIDSNTGVGTDELGFTLVNHNKISYTNESFIVASQAIQMVIGKKKHVRKS